VKILVTGGAGFIGSEFVRSLLQNKYSEFGLDPSEVIVIDALTYAGNLENLTEISKDSRFKFVHGNITNLQLMLDISKGCDLIVNFAAESHVDRSIKGPAIFIETNVLGTYTVLEVARINKIKRVMQVSTDEVYGSISEGSWDENFPLMPNSPYSASKASADLLARSYVKTFGLDVIVTRCCNNYGPYQDPEKLIPLLITKILQGEDLPIYGDGKNIREWIHVSDHARALAFLSQKANYGEIYNIGSGEDFSNIEIAEKILEVMKSKVSKIKFVEDRLGHDIRYSLNFEKLQNLNFINLKNFLNEINLTIEWYTKLNSQELGRKFNQSSSKL
jgi:dTDP-glucose 4,6-dehydratase